MKPKEELKTENTFRPHLINSVRTDEGASISNFRLRLCIITASVVTIIVANITKDNGPGSIAEMFKVIAFLTITCVLGMWAVDRLNQLGK